MKLHKTAWFTALALGLCFGANGQTNAINKTDSTGLAPFHGALDKQTDKSRYIVLLKENSMQRFSDVSMDRKSRIQHRAKQIGKLAGLKVEKSFLALPGFIASANKTTIKKLRAHADVKLVQLISQYYLPELPTEPKQLVADQGGATWGIDRSDQRSLPLNSNYHYDYEGQGVNVYVMDTGINAEHNEFGGRVKSQWNFYHDNADTTDCQGHGSHVAGTIGGSTYGIAKQAILHSVKVYGCAGEPATEDQVVTAMDWVAANATLPAVANLSLSVEKIDPAMDAAVRQAVANGVTVVVAAGNDNDNACNRSPSREPLAITVGSTTREDKRSGFSNYGSCVDIFAPGSSVTSAWHTSNSATRSISGTSMATPHVAGIVALYLAENPNMTPAEVEQKLLSKATPNKLSGLKANDPNLLAYALNDDVVEPSVTELVDGQAVNIAGGNKSSQFYKITVPQDSASLTFTSAGNNGDLDLYGKFGSKPSTESFECKSTSSSSNESCVLNQVKSGDYYLQAFGYSAYSDVTLTATVTANGTGDGETYQGTLTGKDDADIHPNDKWFQYDGGTIKVDLTGPQGTDFDLQLMKWDGQWKEVAKSTSSTSNEQISYVATSGYYQIKVSSYSGSGDYSVTLVK